MEKDLCRALCQLRSESDAKTVGSPLLHAFELGLFYTAKTLLVETVFATHSCLRLLRLVLLHFYGKKMGQLILGNVGEKNLTL